MSEFPTTKVFEISLRILIVNYLWTHQNSHCLDVSCPRKGLISC